MSLLAIMESPLNRGHRLALDASHQSKFEIDSSEDLAGCFPSGLASYLKAQSSIEAARTFHVELKDT